MKLYTAHKVMKGDDEVLFVGMKVSDINGSPHVYIGQAGYNCLYQILKLDKFNMPHIHKDGTVRHGFPKDRTFVTESGLKKHKVYISNPFGSKDKFMSRILTCSPCKDTKSNGTIKIVCGAKEIKPGKGNAKPKEIIYPVIVQKGHGCDANGSAHVDWVVKMKHGCVVQVSPQGMKSEEDYVIGNVKGDPFTMPADRFDKKGFKAFLKDPENCKDDGFVNNLDELDSKEVKVPHKKEDPEFEKESKKFDSKLENVLDHLDEDINNSNLDEEEDNEDWGPLEEQSANGIDNSESDAVLHSNQGTPVD